MNLPNKLTLSRLVLTCILLGVLFATFPFHETAALALFIAASLTDYWDGTIARRENIITDFGVLMDPLADKILTCSLFIAFVGLDVMPAWMAIVIVARELAITGLRLVAAAKNVVLPAEGLGKRKTMAQIIAICAVLTSLSYGEWGGWAVVIFEQPILFGPWIHWFTELSKWVAVAMTFISGFAYLWRNRDLYLNDL